MRLQRALARAGVASRRAAERLIEAGVVRVDGQPASLGMSVDPDRQTITVRGQRVMQKRRRWIALHKPLGVVTTAQDEEGRRTIYELVPRGEGLTYVGRLDVMTTGLLLLTNDGEAAHRLTHPRYRVPRRYTALVHGLAPDEIAKAVHESARRRVDRVRTLQVRNRSDRGDEGDTMHLPLLRVGRCRAGRADQHRHKKTRPAPHHIALRVTVGSIHVPSPEVPYRRNRAYPCYGRFRTISSQTKARSYTGCRATGH